MNASAVPSAYSVPTGAYIPNMEALSPTHASPPMPTTSQVILKFISESRSSIALMLTIPRIKVAVAY